jgi:hypothetical protein
MQDKNHSQRFLLITISLLLLFLTIYPIMSVGYTTADDVEGLTITDSLATILSKVKNSGRLSHYIINTVGHIRVLVDSFAYLKTLSLLPIIGSIAAATYLAYMVFGTTSIAVLFFSLICVAQQNSWQHNILTSFPCSIQLAFMSFLCSLIFFIKHIRSGSRLTVVLSVFLFAFSLLMYEMFVPFVVIFPIIALTFYLASKQEENIKIVIYKSLRNSLTHISAFVLIVTAYLLVRFSVTIYYEGVAIPTEFSVLKYLKAVSIYSLSPIPPLNFFGHEFLYHDLRETFEPFRLDFLYIILNARPEWIARSALIFILTYCGFMNIPRLRARPSAVFAGSIGALLLIFLPNVLIALAPVKQEWTEAGITTYSGTYLSTFALTFAFTGLFVLGWQFISRLNKQTQQIAGGILSLGIAALGFCSDHLNYYVSKAQTHDFMLWRTMDEVVKSDRFKEIGENSLIYAPTLWMSGRYWGLFHASPAMDDYWTKFTYIKTGKTITYMRNWDANVCASALASQKKLYVIKYFQEQDDMRYSVILAEVNPDIVDCRMGHFNASRSLDVFLMSRYDRASVLAELSDGNTKTVISVNNDKRVYTESNTIALGINNFDWSQSQKISYFRLSSEGRAMKLDTFRIIFGGDPFPDLPQTYDPKKISLRK